MSFNIGIAILVNTRFLDLIIILYLRKHELDKYVNLKYLNLIIYLIQENINISQASFCLDLTWIWKWYQVQNIFFKINFLTTIKF
jgi:hypothetical protein